MGKENISSYILTERIKSPEKNIDHEATQKLDARLGSVLGCINTEPKSLLFMGLDRQKKLIPQVFNSFKINMQPYQEVLDSKKAQGYIEKNFAGSGFAEVTKNNKGNYYSLTKVGEIYTKPIAMLGVKVACDENMSMWTLLGSGYKEGRRDILVTNFKIIKAINEDPLIETKELAEKLDINDYTLKQKLSRLREGVNIPFETNPYNYSRNKYEKKYSWRDTETENLEVKTTREEKFFEIVEKAKKLDTVSEAELRKLLPSHKYHNMFSLVIRTLENQGKIRYEMPLDPATKRIVSVGEKFVKPVEEALTTGDMEPINKEIEVFNSSWLKERYTEKALRLYMDVSKQRKNKV